MDFELAGAVILSGLTIVFAVLVLLTFMMMGFGKLMSRGTGKGEPGEKESGSAPAAPVENGTVQRVVEDGISDETVAVISASIAAVLGARFAVRGVKRAHAHGGRSRRPVWSLAGMQQNTNPF